MTAAREAFPDLSHRRIQRPDGPWHAFRALLDVPYYEPRRVTIEFAESYPGWPRVTADGPAGPAASPHRFEGERLCIWGPDDDDDRVWRPADGLLALLGSVQMHLFKEAYWRETGEWVGDEAPHGPVSDDSPRHRRNS